MIYTVTGPIKKEDMGITLSHEHLVWDYMDSWMLYFEKKYDEGRVEHLYNKLLPIFEELYKLGCRTIVEASPPMGGQNLMLMYRLSMGSGIRIIANTGLPFKTYVYRVHKKFNEEELAQRWIEDFKNGLDTINDIVIRPGQIKLLLGDEGEGNLTTIDKKILKASIIASKATDMPIHCHLLKATAASEAIDLLEDESFDFSKFLWAHAGNEGNFEIMEKAFSKGAWLGFDQIRPENYSKSCSMFKEALRRGYNERIILSQDYEFYEEVSKSETNHPCTSFFTGFLEYCERNGISQNTIIDIITKNPSNFFSIKQMNDTDNSLK